MLHALTNVLQTQNEPKHDTQYGCINHFPGNQHQQTTGRACFRWQKTTILQQPTQLLRHTRQKTTIVTSICYAWLHTKYPQNTEKRGLSSDRRTTMRTMVLAGSKISIECAKKYQPPTPQQKHYFHISIPNTPM